MWVETQKADVLLSWVSYEGEQGSRSSLKDLGRVPMLFPNLMDMCLQAPTLQLTLGVTVRNEISVNIN